MTSRRSSTIAVGDGGGEWFLGNAGPELDVVLRECAPCGLDLTIPRHQYTACFSLMLLRHLTDAHIVYTHLNNINPILFEDAPERACLANAGASIAQDGAEYEL